MAAAPAAGSRGSATVALDAMGGDHAPAELVRGALLAVDRLPGLHVTLVGRAEVVQREVARAPGIALRHRERIDIVDAGEVVEMHEHPASAVRSKRDSSVLRACELVSTRRADAIVSAGNSGAVMAAALLAIRRIPGVARPAIGTSLPSAHGQTFVLDVGANADCKAEWLAQFAIMGCVYARAMRGIAEPRVGLLSNGEERDKGSALVQAAVPLLEASPVRFVGNVEGKDLFKGACDVAVTDGFTGNVALKTAEGVAEFLFSAISTEARTTLSGRVGGLLLKPRLRPLRERVDYRRTGGALLLGVAGEVVIAHGRSDAEAVYNALRVANEAVAAGVSRMITREMNGSPQAGSDTDQASATPHRSRADRHRGGAPTSRQGSPE